MTTYTCQKCFSQFIHKKDYRQHIKTHAPELVQENKASHHLDFECLKCNKTFTRKDNLNRHMLLSKRCKKNEGQILPPSAPGNNDISDSILDNVKNNECCIYKTQECFKILEEIDCTKTAPNCTKIAPEGKVQHVCKYVCNYCLKKFTRHSSLTRHTNMRCKIKTRYDSDKEAIFLKLLEEVNELKNTVNKLKEPDTIKSINNTVNNTVNYNYDINVLPYGKEDLSHITEKDYRTILNKGYCSVTELVKYIHFDKSKPENHNIYISNMRDNNIMVFDGKKWRLKNKKELLDDIFTTKRDILVDKFEEIQRTLPTTTINKFNRFMNDQQDKKIVNIVKDDIKLVLYNSRAVPKETSKKIKMLK